MPRPKSPEPPSTAASARKADRVADDLLRRIVRGELRQGAILPREADLADEQGVTRGVVREAVKLLEVHRLLRPVRKRGTVVLDPMQSLSPEVVRAMLEPTPGHIDQAMLGSLLELRAQVDVLMSATAAQRRSEADVRSLSSLVAELSRLTADPPAYQALTSKLGVQIARATHNPFYVMLAHWNDQIVADLAAIFRASRPSVEVHLEGVTTLVDGIKARDVEGVRALVQAFHTWATPRILAAAALSSGDPIAPPPVRKQPRNKKS